MPIQHPSFRARMPKLFLTVKITATFATRCWDRSMDVVYSFCWRGRRGKKNNVKHVHHYLKRKIPGAKDFVSYTTKKTKRPILIDQSAPNIKAEGLPKSGKVERLGRVERSFSRSRASATWHDNDDNDVTASCHAFLNHLACCRMQCHGWKEMPWWRYLPSHLIRWWYLAAGGLPEMLQWSPVPRCPNKSPCLSQCDFWSLIWALHLAARCFRCFKLCFSCFVRTLPWPNLAINQSCFCI